MASDFLAVGSCSVHAEAHGEKYVRRGYPHSMQVCLGGLHGDACGGADCG